MKLLQQEAAAVESCVKSIEYYSYTIETEELRNNWDKLYSTILDLHENVSEFIGEVEK